MTKIYISIISLLLITSCSVSEKPGVIEEVGQTADNYIKTLEGSVNDARSVTKSLNQRQKELQKNLKGQ